jgi:hypothetical protein
MLAKSFTVKEEIVNFFDNQTRNPKPKTDEIKS